MNIMNSKRLSVVFPLYQDNEKTFVMLGKNAPWTKMPGIRNWFGGKCEEGENVLDCAIRETKEETANIINLEYQKEKLKKIWDVIMADKIITFFTIYLIENLSIPDTDAMVDIQWFNINETEKFIAEMLSGDDQIIDELKIYIKQKDNYIPFTIDKTSDQLLAEQTKNI